MTPLASSLALVLLLAPLRHLSAGEANKASGEIAAGRVRGPIEIRYMEERPSELTLEVSIGADGDAVISKSSIKEGCAESWDRRCWERSSRRARISGDVRERLHSLAASADLPSIPREEAAMPGAPRIHVIVNMGGSSRVEAMTGLKAVSGNRDFDAFRRLILDVAGVAP